ncbi:MAG: 2-C-methyl-D-erythritol 2,4-cyclodiphosphate synthase [Leptospirales bacterium]|nr:2-C-methyl-D-erythritol 2,4-cyclodiphosphate synthase [Leptospirales bacterium]
MRVGQGVDFHRLIQDRNRPLMIGGIEIPGDLALQGHSDADVGLHALSDALLGALALGDIGDHFPDTDPAWRNMDSSAILQHCLQKMLERGYGLSNVDLTLLGEQPRIKPHRQRMRERLADLLDLPLDAVSVKATTTEKMGALGREEGLAAMAVVLLIPA